MLLGLLSGDILNKIHKAGGYVAAGVVDAMMFIDEARQWRPLWVVAGINCRGSEAIVV